LGPRLHVAGALAARTFREFDAAATAPLHGFRDADDYYARSSSAALTAAHSLTMGSSTSRWNWRPYTRSPIR